MRASVRRQPTSHGHFICLTAGRIGIGSEYRFNITGLKQRTHNKGEDSSNDRPTEKRRGNSARRSAGAGIGSLDIRVGAIASGERADAEDPLAAGGGLSISRASRAAVDPGTDCRLAAQA